MHAPDGICLVCGWTGQPPIHFRVPQSQQGTFRNIRFTCPKCGNMVSPVGSYTSFGAILSIVETVRDSGLSVIELQQIADAARKAQAEGASPDDFARDNPKAAPLLREAGVVGRDNLMVLLTIILAALQLNATEHSTTTPAGLTGTQVHRIARQVARDLDVDRPPPPSPRKAQETRRARKHKRR